MILFKSDASAIKLMASATPEQIQGSMNAWIDWKDNLDVSISFDWGLPLQTIAEVTTSDVAEGTSPVSGYATMEGDKQAIIDVLQSHPHLQREGSSIDVFAMISMPGM